FRDKPRALADKLTTVGDAVGRLVHDGDYLAIGGFGCDRLPVAVVHEILRQGKRDLAFAGHTATHDFQILCAGNLTGRGRTLAKVDAAYIVGLEARGLSPHARRVMESGTVEVCEWTNYALAVRLQAAAMGVPYLPTANPDRRNPPRPVADLDPVLLRGRRVRGAVRQLSRQHGVRVFLRRIAPAAVAGGREGPRHAPPVPGRVRIRRAGFRGLPAQ